MDDEQRISFKGRVYAITSDRWSGGRAGVIFDLAIVSLIGLSIVAIILESVATIEAAYSSAFRMFEIVTIAVFSIEYVLRIWSSTADPEFAHPIKGRIRFAFRPLTLIDLLAILPFFLPFLGIDLRSARVFRLLRLFRLAKLGRYTKALNLLGRVIMRVRFELATLGLIVAGFILIAATLMYHAERGARTDGFADIPESILWTVSNLTPLSASDAHRDSDGQNAIGLHRRTWAWGYRTSYRDCRRRACRRASDSAG